MIRLKTIAAALVALSAVSVFATSSSVAQFESEAETTFYTTSSNSMQKFTTTSGGSTIECTTINLAGSPMFFKVNETISISPTFTACENFLGTGTAVSTNGCKFVLHLSSHSTTGTTDISCPTKKDEEGKETIQFIEIIVGSICKYTIGSQTGLSSVSYSNTGSGTTREIVVEPNVKGITSTRTTNDLFCPAAGNTGTYTGKFTLTGEDSSFANHVGIFVD